MRSQTVSSTQSSGSAGTKRTATIRELAETVRDLAETDPDIVHQEARDGDIERSCADLSKARSGLGYEPTVDLESGLASLL